MSETRPKDSADDQTAALFIQRMEQLQNFVTWERENNPTKTHIAEWALGEIKRLRHDQFRFQTKQLSVQRLAPGEVRVLNIRNGKYVVVSQSDKGLKSFVSCGEIKRP